MFAAALSSACAFRGVCGNGLRMMGGDEGSSCSTVVTGEELAGVSIGVAVMESNGMKTFSCGSQSDHFVVEMCYR